MSGDVKVTLLTPQQTFAVQAHADIEQITRPDPPADPTGRPTG